MSRVLSREEHWDLLHARRNERYWRKYTLENQSPKDSAAEAAYQRAAHQLHFVEWFLGLRKDRPSYPGPEQLSPGFHRVLV